jgi:DNA-binding NtrC family response regulator
VEDDSSIGETLEIILQQNGYDTVIAQNGQEALQKIENAFFNMALLDIMLPDMQGTELLAHLHQAMPKMIKIMVTGYPSVQNAVDSLNQGAAAYVIKPVKPEKLLALIEEKLAEQSQAEQMTEEKVVDWVKTRAHEIK